MIALLRRLFQPSPSTAARVMSRRAADKRKAERSRYVAAHLAALQADIARELARKEAR